MSRPRQLTDEQILTEARACFLEHGAGVSTELIAERLGVSHAVLFQRFKTKELLLRAALTPLADPPWVQRVRSGPDERPLRTQLLELAEEIHAFLCEVIPAVATLRAAGHFPFSEQQPPEDRPPVRARRELAAWFHRAQGTRRPRVPPEHAADLLLGAMQARPFHRHVAGRAADGDDDRKFIEFAVDALLAMLQAQPRPRRAKSKGGPT